MNEIQKQLNQLKEDVESLKAEIYRNNFSGSQEFNKTSNFTSKLKVPHYASDPATCEVGEIIEVGGKLKICSAVNTWTVCGTQS